VNTISLSLPETQGKFRQFIIIRDRALRHIEAVSNLACARRDPESNTLILAGDGPFFPAMGGAHWAARCSPRQPDDLPLDDLSPILRVLFAMSGLTTSSAPRAEVQAWLRGQKR
jgi:hypothetical protein